MRAKYHLLMNESSITHKVMYCFAAEKASYICYEGGQIHKNYTLVCDKNPLSWYLLLCPQFTRHV